MCECYGLFDPFDEFCYYCPYSFSCELDSYGYYYDDYDEYWF